MLSPETVKLLDVHYGKVGAHYAITGVPEGGAPVEIRREWIGVSLPVRELYLVRFMYGYIGRRRLPVGEDFVLQDVITGKPGGFKMFPVEIRGHDAVDSLEEAKKFEAAEYWRPYAEAQLTFNHYDGEFTELARP